MKIIKKYSLFSIFLISQIGLCATFPEKSIMQDRLLKIEVDEKVKNEFFPLLYRYAGKTRTAEVVSDLFFKSIDRFSKLDPTPQMIRPQLVARSFLYIRSLFSEEPTEMQKILTLFNERWLSEQNQLSKK